mgnify:CR=1 FL=1
MTVNLKGNLQTKVGGKWVTCSFITHDKEFDTICVRPIGQGIVVVPSVDVRNTPDEKTLGSLYKLVRDTSFDKQETDEQSAARFLEFCIKEGLTADINKV